MGIAAQRRGSIAAGISSVNAYVAAVLADTPVGYWKLTEGSGSTVTDYSGNSLTGSYVGTPTLSGSGPMTGETSMTASATGPKYASIPDNNLLDLGDTWTIEFWVYRTSAPALSYLVAKGGNAYAAYCNSGGGQITGAKQGVTVLITSLTGLTADSTWHHIVVTKSGSTRALYYDGADRDTGGTNATTSDTSSVFAIGAKDDGTNGIEGRMAHVAVYATALSSGRVAAHYAART